MCPARSSRLPGYHPCQVLPQHGRMLYRNLFYTGISRAKQLLVLVGSEEVRRTPTPTRAPILTRTLTLTLTPTLTLTRTPTLTLTAP